MKNLKPFLVTLLILLASIIVKAQDVTLSSVEGNNKPDSAKIFTAVEHEPEFKGGEKAFFRYLQTSLHYPAEAVKNHIQGTVFISFIVEADGSLSNVKVVRSVSPDIDAEAIRVIQGSPRWIPGTQNDRPVRVSYTIPLGFSLGGK
jgi:TonB family protein